MTEQAASVRETVVQQPGLLRGVLSAVQAALSEARAPTWRVGERIAIAGMGASTCAGHVLAPLLAASRVPAFSIDASVLGDYADPSIVADHHVFVSESGRSPEPLAAARATRPGRRIGITNEPGSPLAGAVDLVLPLGGFKDSGTYTIGYTATLVAFGLLAREALADGGYDSGFDVGGSPEIVSEALAAFGGITRDIAGSLQHVAYVDAVGHGASFGSAAGAALLLREAAGLPAAAFETYQYLHGPMESCSAVTAVVIMGDGREVALAGELADAGTPVVLLCSPQVEVAGRPGLRVVRLPRALTGIGRALAETAFYQLLSVELAELRGVKAGEFRFEQPDTKLPK